MCVCVWWTVDNPQEPLETVLGAEYEDVMGLMRRRPLTLLFAPPNRHPVSSPGENLAIRDRATPILVILPYTLDYS